LSGHEGQAWLKRLSEQCEAVAQAPGTERGRSNAELVAWLAHMAACDGEVDAKEVEALEAVAERRGVSPDTVQGMLDAARRRELHTPLPADCDEARRWFELLARLAWADGRLTRDEWVLLRRAADGAGLTNADLRFLAQRIRTDVYREARD